MAAGKSHWAPLFKSESGGVFSVPIPCPADGLVHKDCCFSQLCAGCMELDTVQKVASQHKKTSEKLGYISCSRFISFAVEKVLFFRICLRKETGSLGQDYHGCVNCLDCNPAHYVTQTFSDLRCGQFHNQLRKQPISVFKQRSKCNSFHCLLQNSGNFFPVC